MNGIVSGGTPRISRSVRRWYARAMHTRRLVVGLVSGLFWSGIVASSEGCKRFSSSGSFPEKACKGPAFSLSEAVVPRLDYAELREISGFANSDEKDGPLVLQRAGEPCKSARDKASCTARLMSARATRGFSNQRNGRMPGFRYLVVTRGDDVTVVDEADKKLASVLGTVDDPYQAAAVASLERGLVPACERSVRTEDDSFVVHLATDSCFGPVDEVVRIAHDGRVTVLSRETKPASCVGLGPVENRSVTSM